MRTVKCVHCFGVGEYLIFRLPQKGPPGNPDYYAGLMDYVLRLLLCLVKKGSEPTKVILVSIIQDQWKGNISKSLVYRKCDNKKYCIYI